MRYLIKIKEKYNCTKRYNISDPSLNFKTHGIKRLYILRPFFSITGGTVYYYDTSINLDVSKAYIIGISIKIKGYQQLV